MLSAFMLTSVMHRKFRLAFFQLLDLMHVYIHGLNLFLVLIELGATIPMMSIIFGSVTLASTNVGNFGFDLCHNQTFCCVQADRWGLRRGGSASFVHMISGEEVSV
jgi:hypothetical protein